ncbi:MAG TPA: CHASE4 domain-containing protein [Opitutaceae bacterium]|nr:CHASE4 domain-containing protein [Opitutaceae bacterium]
MSTRARLAALFTLALVIYVACIGLLERSQRQEEAATLAALRAERADLLARLAELNGLTLRNFANDYSYWDELVAFVQRPDPDWARENLEVSLATFQSHALWVLRTDGTVVFRAQRQFDADWPAPPLPPAELLARLQRDRFLHFFLPSPAGPVEVRTAPIQPTSDSARVTEPRGWMLVARLWDAAHLESLRATIGGTLEILPPTDQRPAAQTGIHLDRELPGWDGRPAAVLHSDYNPPLLDRLLVENKGAMLLFVLFGLGVLALMLAGVTRWVIAPLSRLEEGLAVQSPAPLANLRADRGEFGRLARLVETSFEHQAALKGEIEERRRVEAALRASEASLREAVELRTRLGRDLHDGVIQSLFAAGLGLEGAREALRNDPEGAGRRLDAARASLNRTIREVRSFITGLEPEGHDRRPFVDTLRSLLQTLQALHPARIRLDLPPTGELPALSPSEELHALQIVREAISNAMRHGRAREVGVRFEAEGGRRRLVVTDDGAGFVPAQIAASSTGSGLANLAARAAEIRADLHIDSAPGRGTRVVVEFGGPA